MSRDNGRDNRAQKTLYRDEKKSMIALLRRCATAFRHLSLWMIQIPQCSKARFHTLKAARGDVDLDGGAASWQFIHSPAARVTMMKRKTVAHPI